MEGESFEDAAVREAFEEGLSHVLSKKQLRALLEIEPKVFMDRKKANGALYRLYVVKVDWFDLSAMNNAHVVEGKKKREFFWIKSTDLLQAWKLSKDEAKTEKKGTKKKKKKKDKKEGPQKKGEKKEGSQKGEKDEVSLQRNSVKGVPPIRVWKRLRQMPVKKTVRQLEEQAKI